MRVKPGEPIQKIVDHLVNPKGENVNADFISMDIQYFGHQIVVNI